MHETYRAESIPEPDAYAFALSQPFVKPGHRRILLAHRRVPHLFSHLDALTADSGEVSFRSINAKYGRLGYLVADCLDIRTAHYSPTSTRPLWTTALAEGGRAGPNDAWYWRMYPEVAEAIDMLGWADG